ncbi:hypothetical protein HMPREF9374_2735 [Desmospora sp. 8437]|nr:hypothetical protein HMPREF9374_2735 [Desmospora sp. 8437]
MVSPYQRSSLFFQYIYSFNSQELYNIHKEKEFIFFRFTSRGCFSNRGKCQGDCLFGLSGPS